MEVCKGIVFSMFVSALASVFSLASTHDDGIMEGSMLFGWMGPLPLAGGVSFPGGEALPPFCRQGGTCPHS